MISRNLILLYHLYYQLVRLLIENCSLLDFRQQYLLLAFFDGANPVQRLSIFSVTIAGFMHPNLVGPTDELAPPSSLVVFEKEDRLGMSLTRETPATWIAALSPHASDRPYGQVLR